ncbi:MAG: ELWxxDGT repeat protein, partial [Cyanobacteriota bacterium]|nr:ELWxxDGT repeat protein [Cyanobacteriota bacterium]
MADLDPTRQLLAVTSLLLDGSRLFLGLQEHDRDSTLALVDLTTMGVSELRRFPNMFPLPSWYSYHFTPPIYQLTRLGSRVYFVASGDEGPELWASDGSAAGTEIVRDIHPGEDGSYPNQLTVFNGQLLFVANDGSSGYELWRSDGTGSGTLRLADLSPYSSIPEDLTVAGNHLYFSAETFETGRELWRTDGTATGTVLVADLMPGNGSSFPDQLTAVGSEIFFVADDGVHGRQLWVSDGTSTGTTRLTNTDGANPYGYGVSHLTAVGTTLFFRHWTDQTGYELWRSDGTSEGTTLVADVLPGRAGSEPIELAAIGPDLVLFAARTDELGTELWQSDGTASGTVGLDLAPGAESSYPGAFVTTGSTILFTAAPWSSGRELWAMERPSSQPPASLAITPIASEQVEGHREFSPWLFQISRSGNTDVAMAVGYQVLAGGSADAADFGGWLPSGGVVFPIGADSVDFSIDVSGDLLEETDETFSVALINPVGAVLDPVASIAGGTILNDDSYTTIESEGNASLL